MLVCFWGTGGKELQEGSLCEFIWGEVRRWTPRDLLSLYSRVQREGGVLRPPEAAAVSSPHRGPKVATIRAPVTCGRGSQVPGSSSCEIAAPEAP